jgi:hypothetical protein
MMVPLEDRGPPRVHWQGCTTALKYQDTKFRKAAREKDVDPTCGLSASPEVGPGATVGTLQVGYSHVQALSQDEGKDVHSHAPTRPWHRVMPPNTGSSGAATPP